MIRVPLTPATLGGLAVRVNKALRPGEYLAFGASPNQCRGGRFGEHPLPDWTRAVDVTRATFERLQAAIRPDERPGAQG